MCNMNGNELVAFRLVTNMIARCIKPLMQLHMEDVCSKRRGPKPGNPGSTITFAAYLERVMN